MRAGTQSVGTCPTIGRHRGKINSGLRRALLSDDRRPPALSAVSVFHPSAGLGLLRNEDALARPTPKELRR